MLPRATSQLPGIDARCGAHDRECEEVLAKQPAHTGNHHWLKVAKDGLGTQQVRAAIARSVAIDPELVACAGNRDRDGRCVQWFSVAKDAVDNPGPLRRAGTQGKMRVLELTASHRPVTEETIARLRWTLHLRGGARGDGYRAGKRLLDRLRVYGCPNYVAAERFGGDADQIKWGRALMQGRRLPARLSAAGLSEARCLHAVQDWLFNSYLATRVADELLATCLDGEVVRGSRGAVQVVDGAEVAHAQKRVESWEALPLGPLFGAGMTAAGGEAANREAAILAASEIPSDEIRSLRGARRATRFQPARVVLDLSGEDLILICELPTEAHIAALIAELLASGKTEAP